MHWFCQHATGMLDLSGFESTNLPLPIKTHQLRWWVFCWWGKVDSNHRSYKQQIYSLSPLATREFPHMKFASRTGLGYHIIFWKNVKKKIQKYEKTSGLGPEVYQTAKKASQSSLRQQQIKSRSFSAGAHPRVASLAPSGQFTSCTWQKIQLRLQVRCVAQRI